MKYLLILSFISSMTAGFYRVAEINTLKLEAEKAFKDQNYLKASEVYYTLLYKYELKDEFIKLNLAHSYFKMEDRKKAEKEYKALTQSSNKKIKSMAFQQLGVLMGMRGKYDIAINHFIQALKTDPLNEKARYNYEMTQKILAMQQQEEHSRKADRSTDGKGDQGKKENKEGTDKAETNVKNIREGGSDQNNTSLENREGNFRNESENGNEKKGNESGDNDPTEKGKQENKSGNSEKDTKRIKRLNRVNLTQDQARMILESMKNEEIQYLQQIRKNISDKNYKNKPDW